MVNVTWIGTPNYEPGRRGQKIDHITLHIMAGYLAGTDSTFQDQARKTSATYGIGGNGAIHQYVRETDTPWSDGDWLSNATGISIEHEGGLPQAQCTRACMDASAELCADIARRHGWKKLVHDGLNGNVYLHREIPGTDHTTCPDLAPNGLDWRYVIDRANQILGYTGNNNGEEPEVVTDKDIERIAKKVWETPVHGAQARDRLLGIDRAANGVLRLLKDGDAWKWLTDRVYRLADLVFNRRDAANSGMVDEHGNEIKRTMYDRLVWIDKRVRELNPYKTGEPRELPIGFALTDEQLDAIANRVADRLKGDAK